MRERPRIAFRALTSRLFPSTAGPHRDGLRGERKERTVLQAAERYIFANQLRGIAAVLVVASHLCGTYWAAGGLVAATTFSPNQSVPPPPYAGLFQIAWLNPGPFGVALFFLISGLVIPISLERQHIGGFLLARAFRIFPTYWMALGVEMLVVALGAAFWHQPFREDGGLLIANVFLVTDIANVPSIDLVNWTLIIELKFYLLAAILAAPIRRGSLIALVAVAALIAFVTRFSHDIFQLLPGLWLVLRVFESNALYVLFMLIGVAFSYHVRGLIGTPKLVAAAVALFALFVVCWPLTFFRGEYPWATFSYGYALVVFGALYALRGAVRANAVLDFFAAISYPLYLVHALVAFSLMQVLIRNGIDPALATAIAFGVAVGLATIIHRTVERPAQALGKALARRAGQERVAVAPALP